MGNIACDDRVSGRCNSNIIYDIAVVAVEEGGGAGKPLGRILGSSGIGVGGRSSGVKI